jgi:serine/threonine-protein kinase
MKPGDLVASKYRLVQPLGEGATSVVWGAVNVATHGQVALKLIQDPNPELRRRLLREARACGSLKHPNIVQVYDVGETAEGEPFLVMEFLAGETLAARLRRAGRLPPGGAVAIAMDVARALRRAHAEGVIHRDLKPANIFLHREPEVAGDVVKVLDFGVSKMALGADATSTSTGTLIGSPAYMSPEQARGAKQLDGRSDLWSVGVVLFEMLTGRRPFPSKTVGAAIAEVLTAPIPTVASVAPEVAPSLSRIVERCLERDVAMRVASADELVKLLSLHVDDPAEIDASPPLDTVAHAESPLALAPPPPLPVGFAAEATTRLDETTGGGEGARAPDGSLVPASPEAEGGETERAVVLPAGAPSESADSGAAEGRDPSASPEIPAGSPREPRSDVVASTASTSTTPLTRSPAPGPARSPRRFLVPALVAGATAIVLVVAFSVGSSGPTAANVGASPSDVAAPMTAEPTSPSSAAAPGRSAGPEPVTADRDASTAPPTVQKPRKDPAPRPPSAAPPRPKKKIDGVDNPN